MDRKDLDVTLYLVTDSSYHTEESLLRTVEEACKGGVTLVQLREKNKGGREYLDKAFKVKEITDRYNVPLIIDDRVDVALACDAAGVHVGASDIPVAVARKLMGPDKIVGATAKTVEAAVKAYEDYRYSARYALRSYIPQTVSSHRKLPYPHPDSYSLQRSSAYPFPHPRRTQNPDMELLHKSCFHI